MRQHFKDTALTSNLLTLLLTMPSPIHQFFFETTTQAIQHGQHLTHMIATHALAWAQAIAVQVVLDIVEQMRQFAVEQAAGCILVYFILAVLTFEYQGECDGCKLCAQPFCQHWR